VSVATAGRRQPEREQILAMLTT